MTDIEINKALALAIGWKESSMQVSALDNLYLLVANPTTRFRVFDYRDWNVIGPIAEKYNCFPYRVGLGGSSEWCIAKANVYRHYADTPQKAIALAVIGGVK